MADKLSKIVYPVTKVNNKTGDVTLGKSDVGLGNVDNVKQYSAENPPPISCVKLLEVANISSTEATSYSCNWSNYDLLIICGCFYGNVCETIVVPKDYFSTTNSSRRVRINNAAYSRIYNVYKNGNNAIYILADQSETTAFGIQIYGVKNS